MVSACTRFAAHPTGRRLKRSDEGRGHVALAREAGLLGNHGKWQSGFEHQFTRTFQSQPQHVPVWRAPKPEETVVLFALPPSEQLSRASGPYLAAALTLQLASAVASADGEFGIKEMGHLRETVMSWKHLTPSHTRRLLAHLRLLMQAPASLTALKKKFEPLDLAVRETIAAFMASRNVRGGPGERDAATHLAWRRRERSAGLSVAAPRFHRERRRAGRRGAQGAAHN